MAVGTLQYSLMARSAEPPAQPTPAAAAGAQPPPSSTAAGPPTSGAPSPQGSPAAQRPPAAASVPPFSILEFQVEGNTLLPTIEVERAVTPFLGESKTIKDVEGARTQLERVYHDRGYKTVLVNIPPQKVSDGVIRLIVTEAAVGKLSIKGSRYHSLQVIRDKMAQFNPNTVPNFPEVQKELGEVNRSADLSVQPVLRASDTPGKVDVELDVNDHLPLHAVIDVNNRYNANTTHLRTTGELRYDNLFQAGQSASFQYQVAPIQTKDAKIWSASYVIPTPGHLVVALYAVHSDSNVAAVGSVDVIGKGDIYGIRLIEPLPADSNSFYHSFTGGIDYKDFKQSVVLEGATSTINTPVSYPQFTLDYSATWLGSPAQRSGPVAATAGGRSNTNLDFSLNFLIQGLATDWRKFAAKRANASASYIVLHPSLSREQVLPGKWSMLVKVDGQLSSGPLINNEQYAAGGADTVRGYTEAERLGDNGARGTLEFRTPQLLAHSAAKIEESYLFVFGDAAKVQTLEPLPGQTSTFTLASAGLGLRFKSHGFTLSLDGARILKDGFVTPGERFRGVFDVSYAY
jgi:hemolysin activation/secretion protein